MCKERVHLGFEDAFDFFENKKEEFMTLRPQIFLGAPSIGKAS